MTEFPETRESLLFQVKDPENREAWDQFALLYCPVIYRLARKRGLQDADAQDLTQQVLMAVASAIGRWERKDESTRFRHWLRRVAKNAIINALSRQPHDRAVGGSTIHELLDECPVCDEETEKLIELEYRRELYRQAAEIVRADVQPETWHGFELTIMDGHSIHAAAAHSGKSVGTIYAARSRIMRRLREAIRTLEDTEQ